MSKAIRKGVSLPDVFIEKVKDYQHKKRISSFSEAIVVLVLKGLEKEEEK